ncbi:recombinase family protein [Patescibacteria group bacterium]|nr:recombinase family protein [Patescibacteria group bacterium]
MVADPIYLSKNKIHNLLCEKVDRLSRNLKEAVVINDWVEADKERKIHFVKQNLVIHKEAKSDEKFRWDIEIVLAKKYISNLSEEVKKGQKAKIAEGWLPTKPPLGYKTAGEKGKKIHVINEDVSFLVVKMFKLYSTGLYSLQKLSDEMFKLGLRSRYGNKVVKSRIGATLSNPFYHGDVVWNGKTYEGKQEPLIDKDLFDEVQNILNNKTTPKYGKHNFLFKGVFECRECGGVVSWENQKKITYGHCNFYRKCTKRPWYKEEEIDNQVAETFKCLEIKNKRLAGWINKALKQSRKADVDFRENNIKVLADLLGRKKKKLDTLYEDRLDERITIEKYDKRSKDLEKEIKDLESKIKKVDSVDEKQRERKITLFELSQDAYKLYKEAKSIDKKRKLIKEVFDVLYLDNGSIQFDYKDEFKVLAEAILETNRSKTANSLKSPINIFELFNNGSTKGKTDGLTSACPIWLRTWDDVRKVIIEEK